MDFISADLQELHDLEEKLWIADFRFDPAWMEGVLADDFFEFGRSGRIHTREACLGNSGKTIDAVIPLTNFQARYVSGDVVQTTYRSVVNYEDGIEYANRSSIWLKTNDGWKLKFHQGTPTIG